MPDIEFKDLTESRDVGGPAPIGNEIIVVQINPDDPVQANRKNQKWSWLYLVAQIKAAIGLATTSISGLLSATDKTKLNAQSGTNTGDETGTTIKTKLGAATNLQDGYLLASDWSLFDGKQESLVSGTNIKTINGSSVLGSGDLVISGGGGATDIGQGTLTRTSIPLTSSSGTGTTLGPATDTVAGTYSADKFIETRPPQKLGTRFALQSSFSSLSGYTNNAAATTSGGVILLSGGTNVTTNNLQYNDFTCLGRYNFYSRIKVTTKSASSLGIGLGIISNYCNTYIKFDASTGVDGGKILVYLTDTLVATSATALTFSVNDVIDLSYERNLNNITARVRNVTTSSAEISVTVDANLLSTTARLHGTGRFTFLNFSGSYEIQQWGVTSNETKYSDLMTITDSKGLYNPTRFEDTFNCKLLYEFPSLVMCVDPGGTLDDAQLRINEITLLAPKQVLICGLGRNNIDQGQSTATVIGKLNTLVTALEAINISVFHLNQMFEPILNLKPYSDLILSTYPSSTIDVYTALSNRPSQVAGDNIHLNTAGNLTVYNTIMASPLIKYQTRQGADILRLNTPVFGLSGGAIKPNTVAPLFVGLERSAGTTVSTADPNYITVGRDYCSTFGNAIKAKLILCDVGNSSNYAIGVSASFMEFFAPTFKFWHKVVFVASSISEAVLNIPSGTVSPTSPAPGDIWNLNGVLKYFTASTTYDIPRTLVASATLDFPSTAAGTNSDLTITLTGAALGDEVILGIPNDAVLTNTCYTAWVSATNTITVRFNNYDLAAAKDPSAGTFKVRIFK